jgi:hypothetical protein
MLVRGKELRWASCDSEDGIEYGGKFLLEEGNSRR